MLPKVVLFLGESNSSNYIFNHLKDKVDIVGVYIDEPVSNLKIFKRRVRKLGVAKSTGQLAFILVSKVMAILNRNKVNKLIESLNLNGASIDDCYIKYKGNLNSLEYLDVLESSVPDVILVNGTRILSDTLIKSLSVKIINTHVGITPKYRGVHGGYWAVANSDSENAGVTVHFIDKGIDTGDVIFQKVINICDSDNFFTYPVKQVNAALPLLEQAVKDVANNTCKVSSVNHKSRLWHHPTLFEYLRNYLCKGVK